MDRLAEALKEDTRLYQIWQSAFEERGCTAAVLRAKGARWMAQRRIVQQLEHDAGIRRLAHLQVK